MTDTKKQRSPISIRPTGMEDELAEAMDWTGLNRNQYVKRALRNQIDQDLGITRDASN